MMYPRLYHLRDGYNGVVNRDTIFDD